MPIYASAKGKSTIPPHPEGQFPAVCIDVIDRGLVESTYQGKKRVKHRVTPRFWCGEYGEREDGERLPLYVDTWFTLTLHEKGELRPFLERWRGKKFTTEELEQFDLEVLIGVPAFLQISQNTVGERTYANIDTIMKLPPSVPPVALLADYVRVCDRPDKEGGVLPTAVTSNTPWPSQQQIDEHESEDDPEIPF